jgi:hypothetical protein
LAVTIYARWWSFLGTALIRIDAGAKAQRTPAVVPVVLPFLKRIVSSRGNGITSVIKSPSGDQEGAAVQLES